MFSIKNIAVALSTLAAVQAVALPSYEVALEHAARGLVPRAFAEALNPALEKRADFMCHAACGLAIYGAWECGPEEGPFDEECLCAADSSFSTQIDACLECGWCIYQSYFGNLAGALDACGLPITPTGSTCIETATGLTPTLGPFTDYTPTHPNNVPTSSEEETSEEPTEEPTTEETSEEPTEEPTTEETTEEPTEEPTGDDDTTEEPTIAPTGVPTEDPSSQYYGNTTTVHSTIRETSIIEYTTCVTDVHGQTTTVTVPCHGKCTASPSVHSTDLTKTYTTTKAIVSGKTVTVTVECETTTPKVSTTHSTTPVPGTTTHSTTPVPGTTTHATTPVVSSVSSTHAISSVTIQTHSGAANKLSIAGAAIVGYAGLMLL